MDRKKVIVFSIMFGLASTIFIAWRVIAMIDKRINHAAILRDVSDSTTGDCECAKKTGERALTEKSLAGKSKIWLFATGEKASANAPLPKGEFKVPEAQTVLEGKGKVLQERQKVLSELQNKCQEMKFSEQSPIYAGVKWVAEHLRSQGCKEGSDCILYVQTDGEELAEKQIRDAINGSKAKDLKLPAPIDNAGIRVIFIGTAQTRGSNRTQDSQRSTRLETVWKTLFTKPENVKFEPYCSQAATP
jgi:hypothetical protein